MLYEFSENVIYDTPKGYNDHNLICIPKDSYVIFNSDVSLSQAIAARYPKLPCEDTRIICNKTDGCEMIYHEMQQITAEIWSC